MSTATVHLQRQLQDLTRNPVGGFKVETVGHNLFKWIVYFAGPEGSHFHPGVYKASFEFEESFPNTPPKMVILSPGFFHPNVFAGDDMHTAGEVCMSILHPQERREEVFPDEDPRMMWSPVQSIEKVLISFLTLLSDPFNNAGSPANPDAYVMCRDNRERYIARCQEKAGESLRQLPEDFVMPDAKPPRPPPQTWMTMEDSEPSAGWGEDSPYYSQSNDMMMCADGSGSGDTDRAGGGAHGGDGGGGVGMLASAPASQMATGEKLQRIRTFCPDCGKSDEQLVQLLEARRGDVNAVIAELC